MGADVVAELAREHGLTLKKGKEDALVAEGNIAGLGRLAVAFPQTFMNDSGRSVVKLCKRYGADDASRLLIVHDELDLDPGVVRLKFGGGLAGHNGLKSLRDHLHSTDFWRLRIGVGRPPSKERGADWVLSKLSTKSRMPLDIAVKEAADAVASILVRGFERTQETVNARGEK